MALEVFGSAAITRCPAPSVGAGQGLRGDRTDDPRDQPCWTLPARTIRSVEAWKALLWVRMGEDLRHPYLTRCRSRFRAL